MIVIIIQASAKIRHCFFFGVFFRDDFCPCVFFNGFDGKTNNVDVTEMITMRGGIKLG